MIDVYVDFESYYDQDYSLKKMPTAQYVRDDRFECQGCAVAIPSMGVRAWLPDPKPLFDVLPWHDVRLWAHLCQFDGLVLTERFRHFPAEYACTMFMARYLISQGLVDPALGTSLKELAPLVGMEKGDLDEAHEAGTLDEYALLDLDIMVALAEKYWPSVPEAERRYIDVHVRMATEPVFDLAVSELQAIADKDKSVEELFPLVRKDDKFVAALAALGVQVEYKTTAKGNMKPALAKTDKFMQKILDNDDPRVVLLAETRQRAKSTIHRSRAQRFMDVGAPLPAPILYYGAGTGRGSGLDKLNMQNLPKKGGLRQCIRAPRFHKFAIVDSSQVEVRVNAWLAGQEDLLEDFRQGRDPYLAFAEFLYDVPYETLVERHKGEDPDTADKRQVAKAAVLALGFMQGAFGFLAYCEGFGIPMDEPTAKRVVDAYRARYQKIVAHARQTYIEVRDTTQQVLPSGRLLTYPGIHAEGRDLYYRRPRIFSKSAGMDRVKLHPGVTVENKVQAVARDAVFGQQVLLTDMGYRVALMVHDEVCLVAEESKAERVLDTAERAFATPPAWAPDMPLAGEARITDVYTK